MKNNNIKIQVFGSGCPSCKKLYESVKETVANMSLGTEVEYIDDIQKLLQLGVMSSPVLVINNKVMVAGSIPSQEKIKQLITEGLENPQAEAEAPKESGGCSCGSGCC